MKLVKEFHPDVNKTIENKIANECMILINYIYEQLVNKKEISLKLTDEYEKDKINGKYWLVNEYGKKNM
jgi:DnaJ-class molecular chaperone